MTTPEEREAVRAAHREGEAVRAARAKAHAAAHPLTEEDRALAARTVRAINEALRGRP